MQRLHHGPTALLMKLGLASLLCLMPHLRAATIAAQSPSQEHVNAAIAASSDGDIIMVPEGTATYTSAISISKAITLMGAGIGRTIIMDDVLSSGGSVFIWTTSEGKAYRMSGFEIRGKKTGNFVSGTIKLDGGSRSMRVDNCKIDGVANEHITVNGGVYGVIDNCEFFLVGNVRAVNFFNGYAFGGSYGDSSYENDVDWGGPGAMYMEDCLVVKPSGTVYSAHDGWIGARAVLRHNSYRNLRIVNHGTESAQRNRSFRSYEIYNNTITNTLNPNSGYIDLRGGSAVIFNNTITGPAAAAIKLNNYRSSTGFQPWGIADGTKAWDGADLSNPARDGVFDTGTSESSGANTLTDNNKNWNTNQWSGYTLRTVNRFTGASGGLRTVTVPNAGWTANQWSGYEFTAVAGNLKSRVSSNTSDTITLATDFGTISMTGGGDFVLSNAAYIASNTNRTITVSSNFQGTAYTFRTITEYEIRKVDWSLDQPGRGRTTPILGSPAPHQNLNQGLDPIYQWNNTLNGSPVSISDGGYSTIRLNREYYNAVKPGYTPYTYPHPLRSGSLATGTPLAPSDPRVVPAP